jgi:hypothetical protein
VAGDTPALSAISTIPDIEDPSANFCKTSAKGTPDYPFAIDAGVRVERGEGGDF